jgi:hypothetical protein
MLSLISRQISAHEKFAESTSQNVDSQKDVTHNSREA